MIFIHIKLNSRANLCSPRSLLHDFFAKRAIIPLNCVSETMLEKKGGERVNRNGLGGSHMSCRSFPHRLLSLSVFLPSYQGVLTQSFQE